MLSVLRIERQRYAFEIFVGISGMEFYYINPSEKTFRRPVVGYPIDFANALSLVSKGGSDFFGYTIKGVGHGFCYLESDESGQTWERLVFSDRSHSEESTELGEDEGFNLKMRPEERQKITKVIEDFWLV